MTHGLYQPRRPAPAQTLAEWGALFRRPGTTADGTAPEAPHGDGSAVLILPGVFRTDSQTQPLRAVLDRIGYRTFPWELGRNLGPTRKLMAGALSRLQNLAERHGPVSLVGFSMGGLFARWLAGEAPALVRQVITVGSPWRAPTRSVWVPSPLVSLAWRNHDLAAMAAGIANTLPVPATSLYSRNDGIVAWESCRDPDADHENIEIECLHVMMERDAAVFRHVADRLARGTSPRC